MGWSFGLHHLLKSLAELSNGPELLYIQAQIKVGWVWAFYHSIRVWAKINNPGTSQSRQGQPTRGMGFIAYIQIHVLGTTFLFYF